MSKTKIPLSQAQSLAERAIPKVDNNYPGFCCQGFDYTIRLIFPNRPGDPVDYTSIWGRCENPDCPRFESEDDPYRGVSQNLLDDFETILEEKGVRVEPEARQ